MIGQIWLKSTQPILWYWSSYSVVSATQNPEILQNTMLISALHYAWNKGDLCVFEPTFLFHKIQSIKQVNQWLSTSSQAKEVLRCAKYISTLCFVEVCTFPYSIFQHVLTNLFYFSAVSAILLSQNPTSMVWRLTYLRRNKTSSMKTLNTRLRWS